MKCPSCGFENLSGADACDNCANSLTRDDVPQAGPEVERSLMEDPVDCLHPVRPLTVERSTSLAESIQLMRNQHIGCVLVTADDGSLEGILTERDLLQKVAGLGLDLDHSTVKDFMTPAPETSRADHPLGYAIQRMIVCDLRYLPLVDKAGRPSGIVSSRDIIEYMAAKFSAVSEL